MHPLHQLRRLRVLRCLARAIDRPIWASLYGVPHPVRLYAIRNASYVVNRRSPEPWVAALMFAVLKSRGIERFWDVGAHIGYYSWLVAATNPETHVVAFEPDPLNLAVMQASRRYAPSVVIVEAAISRADGTSSFFADNISGATGSLESDSSFNARNYHEMPVEITVATRSLDSLAAEHGIPDFLKIDIEGHESEALEGARDTLRHGPLVLIEAFDRTSPALQLLERAGYQLLAAESLRPGAAPDGNYLAVPPGDIALLPSLRREYDAALVRARLAPAAGDP